MAANDKAMSKIPNAATKKELLANIQTQGVALPTLQYVQQARVTENVVYEGNVTIIPSSLVKYLTPPELKIYALVISEMRARVHCLMKPGEMARELGLTYHVATKAMLSLLQTGLLIQQKVKGMDRCETAPNFHTVEYIDQLLKDTKPGTAVNIRRMIRDKAVMRMTELQFNRHNIRTTTNPEEREEYI